MVESPTLHEALKDVDWVNAMHEELNNFTRNQVYKLVTGQRDIMRLEPNGSIETSKIKMG